MGAETTAVADKRTMFDLSEHTTNIDRRTCKRVVPMEVLDLGLSRTGTSCTLTHAHHQTKHTD